MKKSFCLYGILLMAASSFALSPSSLLPSDGVIKGWTQDTKGSCYRGETSEPKKLYSIVDGGAEVYLDRGFLTGAFRGYTDGKRKICVEIYDQGTPENAKKLYQCENFTDYGEYRFLEKIGDGVRIDISSPYSNTMEVLTGRYFIRLVLDNKDADEE